MKFFWYWPAMDSIKWPQFAWFSVFPRFSLFQCFSSFCRFPSLLPVIQVSVLFIKLFHSLNSVIVFLKISLVKIYSCKMYMSARSFLLYMTQRIFFLKFSWKWSDYILFGNLSGSILNKCPQNAILLIGIVIYSAWTFYSVELLIVSFFLFTCIFYWDNNLL